MTKEQEEVIEMLEDIKNNTWTTKYIMSSDSVKAETALNMLKEKDREIEHQIEKRNNQKAELAILNEKQKEMNKLINTVRSCKGMIRQLQKENKEKDKEIAKYEKIYKEYDCYRWVKELDKKDKQIDLMAKSIELQQHADIDIFDLDQICKGLNCNKKCELIEKDCIKQYFEKLAESEGIDI